MVAVLVWGQFAILWRSRRKLNRRVGFICNPTCAINKSTLKQQPLAAINESQAGPHANED